MTAAEFVWLGAARLTRPIRSLAGVFPIDTESVPQHNAYAIHNNLEDRAHMGLSECSHPALLYGYRNRQAQSMHPYHPSQEVRFFNVPPWQDASSPLATVSNHNHKHVLQNMTAMTSS